jgi:Ca-activated chloride channel family protein
MSRFARLGYALLAVALGLTTGAVAEGTRQAPQESRPTFHAGVARVTLNVVVRDGRGRPITGLKLADFRVFDEGELVGISDFRPEDQPISIALVIDTSGSMRIGDRMARARQAAQALAAGLRQGQDEIALFTFDLNLHERTPFSSDLAALSRELDRIAPFGSTALHDAIAATARRSVERPTGRRAVVAITDGIDTSSELSAALASSIASSIDVPIYILGVDDSVESVEVAEETRPPGDWTGRLDWLARWSGGAFLPARTDLLVQRAIDQISSDLRSGYIIAFAPRALPGWHRIAVKVSRSNAIIRTRGGFWMGPR